MDNKIDRIIKKILKEQGNPLRPSGLYNPEMVTVRPENAFDNFDTYKSPNGIGFVIPKKIVGDNYTLIQICLIYLFYVFLMK